MNGLDDSDGRAGPVGGGASAAAALAGDAPNGAGVGGGLTAANVFEVWRQDENGNRFLVSVHGDLSTAEAALREWESGVQHKQLYFVKQRSIER